MLKYWAVVGLEDGRVSWALSTLTDGVLPQPEEGQEVREMDHEDFNRVYAGEQLRFNSATGIYEPYEEEPLEAGAGLAVEGATATYSTAADAAATQTGEAKEGKGAWAWLRRLRRSK